MVANQPAGHRTAIAIDEAQNLSDETLEDLRLLANRIDSQDQELRIVLMGHPELLEHLSAHRLRQLRERISTTVALTPLSPIESAGYIGCRLGAQNGSCRSSRPKRCGVCLATSGIPRRLNVLCHNALIPGVLEKSRARSRCASRGKWSRTTMHLQPVGPQAADPHRAAASFHDLAAPNLIRAAGACAAVRGHRPWAAWSIPAIYD